MTLNELIGEALGYDEEAAEILEEAIFSSDARREAVLALLIETYNEVFGSRPNVYGEER